MDEAKPYVFQKISNCREDEAIIQKEGALLIVKPLKRPSLLALLATLEALDEDFPDVDEGLLPPDDLEI